MTAPSVAEQLPEPVRASVNDLVDIVQTVWDTSFLGLSVGAGLAALGVIVIAFLFRGLFSALIIMSILGIVLFAIIEIAERLLIPWHASRRTVNSASTAA